MVEQYPDIVEVTIAPDYSQDVNGNFLPVSGTGGSFTSECRSEKAGNNPVIKGVDGNDDIVYQWVVYMPQTSDVFEYGSKVKITRADGGIYESSLKWQYNGQLNSRLWV